MTALMLCQPKAPEAFAEGEALGLGEVSSFTAVWGDVHVEPAGG